MTSKVEQHYLSELCVLPAVDDNITAGVEDQEQVGEVGQQVAPWGARINKQKTLIY